MKVNKRIIALTFLVVAVLFVSFKVFYNASLQEKMYGNNIVESSSNNQGILLENNLAYKKADIKKENKNQGTSVELTKEGASNPTNVKSTGKVIVIDPGHANRSNLEKEPLSPGSNEMKIKDGGGAEGIVTKTPEYALNLKVSMRLKVLLEQKGYTVVMTKTTPAESLGNVERAEIGNKASATLVVRIHADSSDDSSVTGASMLIPAAINSNTNAIYSESKRCGEIVLNTFCQEVGAKNRGVSEHSDMTGFNWSKVPVILIEMGFMSNVTEDKLLNSEAYEDKMSKALADGIFKAIN